MNDIEDLRAILDLQTENARLRKALVKYGDHLSGCPHIAANAGSSKYGDCSCGYSAAIATTATEAKQPPLP